MRYRPFKLEIFPMRTLYSTAKRTAAIGLRTWPVDRESAAIFPGKKRDRGR
jgi:hypothetical protein